LPCHKNIILIYLKKIFWKIISTILTNKHYTDKLVATKWRLWIPKLAREIDYINHQLLNHTSFSTFKPNYLVVSMLLCLLEIKLLQVRSPLYSSMTCTSSNTEKWLPW
jgi:hypothetical protein